MERFGHLVWKEPVIVHVGKSKRFATFGDMMVIPAKKYLWIRTTSLAALRNAVNGICVAIDLLLHPSIIFADRVQSMFRNLLNAYSQTNGNADPHHMAEVLLIRVQQHMEELREL